MQLSQEEVTSLIKWIAGSVGTISVACGGIFVSAHRGIMKKFESLEEVFGRKLDKIEADIKPLNVKVEVHEEKIRTIDSRVRVVEDWKEDMHTRVMTVERSVKEIVQGYNDN